MPTGCSDLVLVYVGEKPAFYARVEDISQDVKPGWWQVKLLVLTHPIQIYTWILEESQINGAGFTMGGTPVKLEKVDSPVHDNGKRHSSPREAVGEKKKTAGRVVTFPERKKEE